MLWWPSLCLQLQKNMDQARNIITELPPPRFNSILTNITQAYSQRDLNSTLRDSILLSSHISWYTQWESLFQAFITIIYASHLFLFPCSVTNFLQNKQKLWLVAVKANTRQNTSFVCTMVAYLQCLSRTFCLKTLCMKFVLVFWGKTRKKLNSEIYDLFVAAGRERDKVYVCTVTWLSFSITIFSRACLSARSFFQHRLFCMEC